MISHTVGTSLLKLLCVDAPPPREEGGIDAAVGYRLLTLVVPDLDGLLARVEQTGVTGIERDTFDAGSVQFPLAFLDDPDGNALELVGVAGAEPSLQVGMTVTDIDRTLHFYRDVLGFDEEPPISRNGIDRRSVRFGATSLEFWHRGDGLPVRTGSSTERAGIRYVTRASPPSPTPPPRCWTKAWPCPFRPWTSARGGSASTPTPTATGPRSSNQRRRSDRHVSAPPPEIPHEVTRDCRTTTGARRQR